MDTAMDTTESPSEDEKLKKLTVDALRNSQAGLDEFRGLFTECSDLFDQGNDVEGVEKLKEMLPRLREFAEFCASIMDACEAYLEKEVAQDFLEKCESFSSFMGILVEESEKNNFVEVSDIIRFDFCDLMASLSVIFPKLADDIEKTI